MQVGSTVTIHTYDRSWRNAKIVRTDKDNLEGTRDVFIVRCPEYFENDELHFYQQADSQGKRYNVGNAAFWIE